MTVAGLSIAHHQALAEQDAARVNEIRELGVRRSRARVSLEVAEQLLAARLHYFHEGGLAVDELAAARPASRGNRRSRRSIASGGSSEDAPRR